MSVLSHNHEVRRRAAARRALGSDRTRRAGTGTVTEMARELLREAREAERGRMLVAGAAQTAPSVPAFELADAA